MKMLLSLLHQQRSKNTVDFCNKVVSVIIYKYNQSKLELDNNKFNQNLANIQ